MRQRTLLIRLVVAFVIFATLLAPFGRIQPTNAVSNETIEYFALGDSIASGHGLMDIGPRCYESNVAYPYTVAAMIRGEGYSVDFPPGHHLACSGAKTWDLGKQVDAMIGTKEHPGGILAQRPKTNRVLVSITIGVDDFPWTSLKEILPHFTESDAAFNAWVGGIAQEARKRIEAEVTRLLEASPRIGVILTEYHNPFNRNSTFFRPRYR